MNYYTHNKLRCLIVSIIISLILNLLTLDEDKAVMNYKPGSKSFSVLGFTDISSVPFYLLSGECSYMVLPRERDEVPKIFLVVYFNIFFIPFCS